MPGKKLKSIKPAGRKMYEGLKRRGMSKSQAAAIANSWAKRDGKADGKGVKRKGKKK